MSSNTNRRRLPRVMAAAVAAAGMCTLALPLAPAHAQVPYLGVDFGNGFGIGIGVPPSVYGMAPVSVVPYVPPVYVAPPYYYYYP